MVMMYPSLNPSQISIISIKSHKIKSLYEHKKLKDVPCVLMFWVMVGCLPAHYFVSVLPVWHDVVEPIDELAQIPHLVGFLLVEREGLSVLPNEVRGTTLAWRKYFWLKLHETRAEDDLGIAKRQIWLRYKGDPTEVHGYPMRLLLLLILAFSLAQSLVHPSLTALHQLSFVFVVNRFLGLLSFLFFLLPVTQKRVWAQNLKERPIS